MRTLDRSWLTTLAAALLVCTANAQQGAGSANATPYQVPRTSWGDPDLSGIWPGTAMVGVPMQRDEKLGTRNVLTEEEFQAREAQFARQEEQDNADFSLESAASTPGGDVGGPVSPPPHWLERGDPQYQASLIVEPPNGRMPPLTDAGTERQAAVRAARQGRGPADSYTDRSLYDRCITRGMIGSLTPAIYNAGNEIVQGPGVVALRNEMIHEARVIPLDGRPHLSPVLRSYMGDTRGRWDGDTLVLDTVNVTDKTGVGANGRALFHSEALHVIERFTRTAAGTLQYSVTIDDPRMWTRPWTMSFPLQRDDTYGMFEYACHEGNYGLRNILSASRADERR